MPAPPRNTAESTGARANPGAPTSRLGRYEITGRLATGGMATVYLARLEAAGGFSREFALKVVHPHLAEDPGFRRRFFRETTVASRVRHPNAITTIDAGEDRGYSYLVLELVDGVTLRQLLLHLSRPLSAPLTAQIIAMVARGLHALHTVQDEDGVPLGVVHRDLSPQNVMIDRSGRVVLIDLGLAKIERDGEATQVGVLVGKLPYMSPEQARIDSLDARSDVFALGTVAYELCTGTLPFGDAHTTSTLEKLQACDNETLAANLDAHGIPDWLGAIILRCLQSRPRNRFDSALELSEALTHALQHAGHDETTLRRRLAELVTVCGPEMVKVHPADPLPPRLEPVSMRNGHPLRWAALGAAGVLAMMLGLHLTGSLRSTTATETHEPADSATLAVDAAEARSEPESARASPRPGHGTATAAPLAAGETTTDGDLAPPGDTEAAASPRKPRPRRKRPVELKPNPYAAR